MTKRLSSTTTFSIKSAPWLDVMPSLGYVVLEPTRACALGPSTRLALLFFWLRASSPLFVGVGVLSHGSHDPMFGEYESR